MSVETITSLSQLQEMRNKEYEVINTLRDTFNKRADTASGKVGHWEGDEKQQWDDVNERYNSIIKRIETVRTSDELQKRFEEIDKDQERRSTDSLQTQTDQTEITHETRMLAFQGWLCQQQTGKRSKRQAKAMKAVRLSRHRKELQARTWDTATTKAAQRQVRRVHSSRVKDELLNYFENRQMSTDPAGNVGGQLIPEGFVRQVEINRLAYGSVRQAADIITTGSGNPLPWPTIDDVANKGALIGENTQVGEQAIPTSNTVWNAYKFTSRMILVSYELLQDEDVAPSLPEIIGGLIGERIGRIEEEMYTVGTGTGQPQGITAAPLGHTAGAGAITYGDVIELEHSVDPAYRMGAAYMMHDGIFKVLRLLVDGDGRPLYQNNMRDGAPDTLNGRMVYINQEMANDLTATNKIMLFGDLTQYKIRQVADLRLYRLVERYRDFDQDGFVGFNRCDGRILNAGTAPIKHMAAG